MTLNIHTGQPDPQSLRLKIKKLHPDAVVPKYATAGAACFDLHAIDDGLLGKPGNWQLDAAPAVTLSTGLAFEVPAGHVLLIFSRSGHGFNADVRLANCVGVIDSDYRGEVKVRLTRDKRDEGAFAVAAGERIAQAMLVPIPMVELVEVDELSTTERGEGGFGSTGA